MPTLKKFLIIAVIVFAIVDVLFTCNSVKELLLVGHHMDISYLISRSVLIIVIAFCSVLLTIGALGTKPSLLICCQILFSIRIFWFSWNFKSFYELTLGCDDDNIFCPDDKKFIFFRLVFLNGELVVLLE